MVILFHHMKYSLVTIRLFFEGSADQQVGFVNNSSESVTISGYAFTDAPGFKIGADPTNTVITAGGVFIQQLATLILIVQTVLVN